MKSESTINLDTALVKAQAEMPVVEFDAINPFLKNKYASLGAVIQAVRAVLSKYGLAFIQFPISDGGYVGVESIIVHSSGEWRSEKFLLPVGEEKGKSLAQVAGSIVTYLRRYALSAMFGLYADEDTDGGKSAATTPSTQRVLFGFLEAIALGVNVEKETELAMREDGVGTLARLEMLRRVPQEAPTASLPGVLKDAKALFFRDYDTLRDAAGLIRGEKDAEYEKLATDLFGNKVSTIGELLWMWRVMAHLVNGSGRDELIKWYKTLNTDTASE